MSTLDPVQIRCPYCGEQIRIQVDVMSADEDYIEDCTVCCRPIRLHVARDENGLPTVLATSESE